MKEFYQEGFDLKKVNKWLATWLLDIWITLLQQTNLISSIYNK